MPFTPIHIKPFTSPRNKLRQEELVEKLLPALIMNNPPENLKIKQGKINISHTFLSKYLSGFDKTNSQIPSSASPNLQSAKRGIFSSRNDPIPAGTKFTLTTLKKSPELKTFYKTFTENPIIKAKAKHSKMPEAAASLLITSTLKIKKMQAKQREISKKREEADHKRTDYIKRLKTLENAQLETNTRNLIEHYKLMYQTVFSPRTDKSRYIERISKKHKEISNFWSNNTRTQQLSTPIRKGQKQPYSQIVLIKQKNSVSSPRDFVF